MIFEAIKEDRAIRAVSGPMARFQNDIMKILPDRWSVSHADGKPPKNEPAVKKAEREIPLACQPAKLITGVIRQVIRKSKGKIDR